MTSLRDNDVFEVGPSLFARRQRCSERPLGVYRERRPQSIRAVARYVAKGFSQVEGVDYHEMFAPTTKMTSIRTMANVVAQHDMVVHQLDVKSAYLHAPIDCELYLEPPHGFAGTNEECLDEVKCELKSKFKMSDFGKLSYFLGIQFKFEGNTVKMTQSLYLQKILERFGMQDCKPRKTPCDPNLHFS